MIFCRVVISACINRKYDYLLWNEFFSTKNFVEIFYIIYSNHLSSPVMKTFELLIWINILISLHTYIRVCFHPFKIYYSFYLLLQ